MLLSRSRHGAHEPAFVLEVSEASADALRHHAKQGHVLNVESFGAHDGFREFVGGGRSLGCVDRAEHDPRRVALHRGKRWRNLSRCEVGDFKIGRENSQRGLNVVEVNDGLTQILLQVFDTTGEFGALGDQGGHYVGKGFVGQVVHVRDSSRAGKERTETFGEFAP